MNTSEGDILKTRFYSPSVERAKSLEWICDIINTEEKRTMENKVHIVELPKVIQLAKELYDRLSWWKKYLEIKEAEKEESKWHI